MSISKDTKIVIETVFKAFDGKPIISGYSNTNKDNSIKLLSCNNRPDDGLTSISTVGLSNHSIGFTINELPLRIELVGVFDSEYKLFENILVTCAFHIINNSYACSPDTIFKDLIEQYIPKSDMKHILFVVPFLWKDKLDTLSFDDKMVTWLHAIPISQKEYRFARDNGVEALEDLFEKEQINIASLMRKSIV